MWRPVIAYSLSTRGCLATETKGVRSSNLPPGKSRRLIVQRRVALREPVTLWHYVKPATLSRHNAAEQLQNQAP